VISFFEEPSKRGAAKRMRILTERKTSEAARTTN
jgi:hypothetical protein